MKVLNVKPYINFASNENQLHEMSDSQSFEATKKEKKEKIIKYSIASAAAAAIVIGGLYYIGRHGGKIAKKNPLKNEIPPAHTKTENHGNVNHPGKNKANGIIDGAAEKPDAGTNAPEVKNDGNVSGEPNRQKIRKPRKRNRNRVRKGEENKINPQDIPDSKKPFVLDKKYFNIANIEGQRNENVVRQYENGMLKCEFAADDGTNLSFYSEFDNGKRIIDVEFRQDTTVRAIRKYKNGEFSKISFYEKDGTLAKKFDNEDEADFFNMNFD